MSFYDVLFTKLATLLLPPDKRQPKLNKWTQSLLSQNTWLHTKIFKDYKEGATYANYVPLTSYSKGAFVAYGESIYESLVNSNTSAPTDATKWRVYQVNFIGVDERLTYNHIKLVLEHALNKRFQTTFNQPPLISDIYITTNSKGDGPFIVGYIESESSDFYRDHSDEYIINGYTFGTVFNNFTVWVPLAVYNGVSTDPAAREKIFRTFIDRYNTIGLNYNIQTY